MQSMKHSTDNIADFLLGHLNVAFINSKDNELQGLNYWTDHSDGKITVQSWKAEHFTSSYFLCTVKIQVGMLIYMCENSIEYSANRKDNELQCLNYWTDHSDGKITVQLWNVEHFTFYHFPCTVKIQVGKLIYMSENSIEYRANRKDNELQCLNYWTEHSEGKIAVQSWNAEHFTSSYFLCTVKIQVGTLIF